MCGFSLARRVLSRGRDRAPARGRAAAVRRRHARTRGPSGSTRSTCGPHAQVGAAIHSVRAVAPRDMEQVVGWAGSHVAPLHAHVSEQPAENAACFDAYGMSPTQVLHEARRPGRPIHGRARDPRVGRRHRGCFDGSTVCVCPTTERDLADGIAPSGRLREGVHLAVGSDSNAVVDLLEEARAIELDTRLATRRARHALRASSCSRAARLAARGSPRERRRTSSRSAPTRPGSRARRAISSRSIVFSASAADVTDVMVAGRDVVCDRAHVSIDVVSELADAVRDAWDAR